MLAFLVQGDLIQVSMSERLGNTGFPDSGLSRWSLISQKIGDGIRMALGTVLLRPDGYLYPHDVREKAADINGLVSILGNVSTATAVERARIVDDYKPRQIAGMVSDSERTQWTARPGFYGALAGRVTRDTAEPEATFTHKKSSRENKSRR